MQEHQLFKLEIKLNKNVSKISILDRLSLSHLPSLSLAASHALLGPFVSHYLIRGLEIIT